MGLDMGSKNRPLAPNSRHLTYLDPRQLPPHVFQGKHMYIFTSYTSARGVKRRNPHVYDVQTNAMLQDRWPMTYWKLPPPGPPSPSIIVVI